MAGFEELIVASDRIQATLLPGVGGRLHALRVDGRDLLRTPDTASRHAREPFHWGAYPMAPWCNRIAPGETVVRGRRIALEPNFDDGTVIHGQVFLARWDVVGDSRLAVSGGGDGWPWTYTVTLDVSATESALELRYRLRNTSDDPMPAGLGLHPWFTKPLAVRIPADRAFRTNIDQPAHPEPVDGPFDLRQLREMPPDLDATWTDLTEPIVELHRVDLGVGVRIQFSKTATYVVAASPPSLDAVAVEPQTHAPNGLGRLLGGEPGALEWLDPGGALELDVRFVVRRTSSAGPWAG
jgi:aldose 1-epimerase